MAYNKLNNIFGPDSSRNNNTIFHSIANADTQDICDRISNNADHGEFQHILLKNDDGDTCLHIAAKTRSGTDAEVMIMKMLDIGASLDAQDNNGDTVLHIAVRKQDYELIEGLIDVDGGIKNNDGLTAYQVAERINDKEAMKMLSNYGVK